MRFQDRKLNACSVCGTRRDLAITARPDGTLHFLCRVHMILLLCMQNAVSSLGVRL